MTRGELSARKISTTTSREKVKQDFERKARHALREWSKTKSAQVPHPMFAEHFVSPRDRMYIRIYKLVHALKPHSIDEVFREMANEAGKPHRGSDDVSSILVDLVEKWNKEIANPNPWVKQRRSEFGQQIAYADHHKVSPRFFHAFIKEAGLKSIGKNLAAARARADAEELRPAEAVRPKQAVRATSESRTTPLESKKRPMVASKPKISQDAHASDDMSQAPRRKATRKLPAMPRRPKKKRAVPRKPELKKPY